MCKSRVAITPVYWCWSVQEERHFSIFHVVFETISLFFPPQCKTAEKDKKRKRKGSLFLLGVRLFVLGRMVSDCSEHVLSADGVQADRANKVLAFFFFFTQSTQNAGFNHSPAGTVCADEDINLSSGEQTPTCSYLRSSLCVWRSFK